MDVFRQVGRMSDARLLKNIFLERLSIDEHPSEDVPLTTDPRESFRSSHQVVELIKEQMQEAEDEDTKQKEAVRRLA